MSFIVINILHFIFQPGECNCFCLLEYVLYIGDLSHYSPTYKNIVTARNKIDFPSPQPACAIDYWATLHLPLGFAGGLVDRDTDLVHFCFCHYDPYVGRFITPDPLGGTGGDHDLYDYCVDDPVTTDAPSGLLDPFPAVGLFLGTKAIALPLGALDACVACNTNHTNCCGRCHKRYC